MTEPKDLDWWSVTTAALMMRTTRAAVIEKTSIWEPVGLARRVRSSKRVVWEIHSAVVQEELRKRFLARLIKKRDEVAKLN